MLLRGDFLDYTEKEKKGIDRVERMNQMFDKIILPAIGILIIMLLISFTVNKYREKFGSGGQNAVGTVSQQNGEPEVFALRRRLLGSYSDHKKEFEAYGYEPVEGYSYALSLCKTVDGEMSIFQFSDGSIGELTIITYTPENKTTGYDSLSMAISSHTLINVTAKSGEERHTVTFTDTAFSAYKAEDDGEYKALMKLTDIDEITTLYEIFETDTHNLAKNCMIK